LRQVLKKSASTAGSVTMASCVGDSLGKSS
jgi:hypothetical protein